MRTEHRPEAPAGRFVPASELAEFVFCRRAWYYRLHPELWPEEGPGDTASLRQGRRVHQRIEHGHLSDQSLTPWRSAVAAVVGLLLLGVWFWWTFR